MRRPGEVLLAAVVALALSVAFALVLDGVVVWLVSARGECRFVGVTDESRRFTSLRVDEHPHECGCPHEANETHEKQPGPILRLCSEEQHRHDETPTQESSVEDLLIQER